MLRNSESSKDSYELVGAFSMLEINSLKLVGPSARDLFPVADIYVYASGKNAYIADIKSSSQHN